MSIIKTYNDLSKLCTYDERLRYLQIHNTIGSETFGLDRYINQKFYKSKEWNDIKRFVIIRDNGCDLGIDGLKIYDRIIVHHMNPITIDDILSSSKYLYDPDYLICTSINTHNMIHYGVVPDLSVNERSKNDTILWKRIRGTIKNVQ